MVKALVLTAITGAQIGTRYSISDRSGTIGSSSACSITIHDRQLAGRQAEVRQILDRWFIVPITNGGMSLNGMPITSQSRLNPGDQLSLGTTIYRVSYEELREAEVGAPAPSASQGVPRLGDYFVQRGILTQEQIGRVARRQMEMQRSGVNAPFGQVAYDMGLINQAQLERALSEQRNDFNTRFRD